MTKNQALALKPGDVIKVIDGQSEHYGCEHRVSFVAWKNKILPLIVLDNGYSMLADEVELIK